MAWNCVKNKTPAMASDQPAAFVNFCMYVFIMVTIFAFLGLISFKSHRHDFETRGALFNLDPLC